jgi:hypothetical protein
MKKERVRKLPIRHPHFEISTKIEDFFVGGSLFICFLVIKTGMFVWFCKASEM